MEEGKVRWRRGKCGGGGESEVEELMKLKR